MARTTTAHNENGYSYRAGMEFEIEEHATAEEADSDDGFGYYLGNRSGGFNNVEVREDHVELVKTRAQMQARELPSLSDVAEHLAKEAHGGDLGVYESDWGSGEGIIYLYGETEEGVHFAAEVKVLSVQRTDF